MVRQISSQTVLVVDDENDNLVLVSLWLQDLGYRIVTAVNGRDAVAVAKLARPQLILMDIAMPETDGLEATQHLRGLAEFSDVPIVFLTAFDTEDFRRRASHAGGDGYLTKPIDFTRLGHLIRTLLSRETSIGPASTGATESSISDETGKLDPRFMLWRMFCAENNVLLETLPSQLSRDLRKKWEQLKKTPRPLFKF